LRGEVKYSPEPPDFKPGRDNAVEAGYKMTITFAPQSATVNAVDWAGHPGGVSAPRALVSSAATRGIESDEYPEAASSSVKNLVSGRIAGVEDYQVAPATYRAAYERWPGTPITLRQGAQVTPSESGASGHATLATVGARQQR
jgi:hypothetical protein